MLRAEDWSFIIKRANEVAEQDEEVRDRTVYLIGYIFGPVERDIMQVVRDHIATVARRREHEALIRERARERMARARSEYAA